MEMLFSTKGSFVDEGDRAVLGVAANSLDDLARLVRGRLAFGRSAELVWPEGLVALAAAERTAVTDVEGLVTVHLDAADREALLALPVARGDYPLPSGRVTVRVLPVDILDGARKRVTRTIG
jgi:hypothetical protein